MQQKLESNLSKMFWYLLTQRRNFIPLLSIYFLTLPNSTANQIGIFMGLGSIAGFLFEIPSGYISDRFGHKNALIFAKVCNLLSTSFFILGGWFSEYSFMYFILGSIFLSLSFSFTSGTISAFIHDTLTSLSRESEFTKVFSRIRGNVSLLSIAFILIFPLFTEINIIFPFYIAFMIDAIGLWIALLLIPIQEKKHSKKETVPLRTIIKQSLELHLLPFAIFSGAIGGIELGLSPFRSIYLESLGFPIILIGTIMGLSRFVWFIIGNYAHIIQERLSFKYFLLLRMIISVGSIFLIVIFQNPYVVGIIFAIANGFKWGVSGITQDYTFKYYLPDPKYKATLSSIKSQVSLIIQVFAGFGTGYIISITNYQIGYFVVGLSLFIILITSFIFIKVKQK